MSRSPLSEEDIANLSDDDILNMISPDLAPSSQEQEEEPVEFEKQEEAAPEANTQAQAQTEEDASDEEESEESDDADSGDAAGNTDGPNPDQAGETESVGSEKADQKTEEAKDKDPNNVKTEVDYKQAYERIMGPFKANGKDIQLKSIDEAIQLMQMGANYTKKLQALQPNLKMLKMLENNGLLDEGKLSYLIDIDKKNPQAIQKLLRDSGIDPMEIDTSVEPAYRPSNHRVSDEEMVFTSTLEEVVSDPVGKEMIVHINKTWDARSKEALWSDPAIMRVMTDQKNNGIYDQISTEIERRRILGHLRNEPFLQAYQMVGQQMQEQGLLVPRQQANGGVSNQPSRVVDVRPALKKTVDNQTNEKARAASPVKTAPKKTVQDFNPLALSDEDFEKNAALANRL